VLLSGTGAPRLLAALRVARIAGSALDASEIGGVAL
jgi:hypothetical protein